MKYRLLIFWINIQIKYYKLKLFINKTKYEAVSMFKDGMNRMHQVNCVHVTKKKLITDGNGRYTYEHKCLKCGFVSFDSRMFTVIQNIESKDDKKAG